MKENNLQEARIFEVPWTDTETYAFAYTAMHDNFLKQVYIGHFLQPAPEGLDCETTYCVKVIDSVRCELPQNREFFDLVDFQGDHLRQICARNPRAKRIAERIRENGSGMKATDCVIVEPYYKKMDYLYENSSITVPERLDVILQCALGLQELMSPENSLGGNRVVAYRDMKESNVMGDLVDGRLRIRLVDFAAIRLAGEHMPDPRATVGSFGWERTCKAPMSAGNTTPEILPDSPYEVSEKTDIYSLGMMLAHFFLRADDQYINPGYQWAMRNGWANHNENLQLLQEDLKNAFEKCLEEYEPTAAWNQTWIERALHDSGLHVRWERLPDPRLQKMIRTLFFHATHIDPAKRIDLKNFIAALRTMLALEPEAAAEQTTVSVYLFDRYSFKANSRDYFRAAAEALRREQEDARRAGRPEPCALCFSYRRRSPLEPKNTVVAELEQDGLCQSVPELEAVMDRIITFNTMMGDTAACALLAACRYLESHEDQFRFSGRVYLFTPTLAGEQRMEPVTIDGRSCGMSELCRWVSRRFEGAGCAIRAYAAEAPEITTGGCDWCDFVPLGTGAEPKEAEPDRSVFGHLADAAHWDQFETGADALYIQLSDGRKAYIGMK